MIEYRVFGFNYNKNGTLPKYDMSYMHHFDDADKALKFIYDRAKKKEIMGNITITKYIESREVAKCIMQFGVCHKYIAWDGRKKFVDSLKEKWEALK